MLRTLRFIANSYNQPTACYTVLNFLWNALHLACSLKKLLTILILITLAGQTCGCFHSKADDISLMKEAEDKGEKGSENKNEKEYVSLIYLGKPELHSKRSFSSYSCKPYVSPLLEDLTPPPDVMI